jgi:hypothetical protein
MSRIKATVRFLHAWQCPDQIAREVEEELRFHIAKRTRANIESGLMPPGIALETSSDSKPSVATLAEAFRSIPRPLKWGCTLPSQFCQGSPRCGRSTFHITTSLV